MKTLTVLIIVSVGIVGVMSGIILGNTNEFSNIFDDKETDSSIPLDNSITSYEINTKCQVLLSLYDLSLQEKTINEVADIETLMEKYPVDGEIIIEYTFDLIQSDNLEYRPTFQSLPPLALNSMVNIMSDIGSVDPTLKPFLKTVLSGEITSQEIAKVLINDNTDCEKQLAPYITTTPPSV